MTINPCEGCQEDPWPCRFFRPSDWFQLGLKTDLEKYANCYDVIEKNLAIGPQTERLWFGSILKKYANSDFDVANSEKYYNLSLIALLNNFRIVNTRITAGIENFNWTFQPEKRQGYITEEIFDGFYKEYAKK